MFQLERKCYNKLSCIQFIEKMLFALYLVSKYDLSYSLLFPLIQCNEISKYDIIVYIWNPKTDSSLFQIYCPFFLFFKSKSACEHEHEHDLYPLGKVPLTNLISWNVSNNINK